jgi:Zn-dependent peptidase ImmA (M78 family)
LPVPIADIADSCFNLLIRDVEDLTAAPGAPVVAPGQSLSGLLLPSLGEIWVNAREAREWPHRRRFTVGHEVGHWCLHRTDEEPVYCRSTSVAEKEATPAVPPTEEEANAFAAALLMPARLVEREYERDRKDFWKLCGTFGVSGAAMGRRLHAVI